MVRFDLNGLVTKLVEAGIPEHRARLLALAFNESIEEVSPVSRDYVNKVKNELRSEFNRNILLLLCANLMLSVLAIAIIHFG